MADKEKNVVDESTEEKVEQTDKETTEEVVEEAGEANKDEESVEKQINDLMEEVNIDKNGKVIDINF